MGLDTGIRNNNTNDTNNNNNTNNMINNNNMRLRDASQSIFEGLWRLLVALQNLLCMSCYRKRSRVSRARLSTVTQGSGLPKPE